MDESVSGRRTLLDEDHAARWLGLSVRTLQSWRCRRSDGPPFIRLGRAIRYDPDDLDNFIAKRRRRSTADDGGSA